MKKDYHGKKITYEEFLELYEKYKGEVSEVEFGSIIGLNYSKYYYMKYDKREVEILSIKYKSISDERKEAIRKEIVQQGIVNTKITYEEFLKLYEPYRAEVSEEEFAEILDIRVSSYKNMKNKGMKAQILKIEYRNISEERKKEIRNELQRTELDYRTITYEEFLEIYREYKEEISEVDFAIEILGINYSAYSSLKNGYTKSKINFNRRIYDRVKHYFENSRFYSEEEIENVAIKYGINIEDVIKIIYDNDTLTELLPKALIERKGLYIGERKLNDEFLERYMHEISEEIHKFSMQEGNKLHTISYAEDIAQEVLVSILNKGDIIQNLGAEIGISMLIRWGKVRTKYLHYRNTTSCKKRKISG